MAQGINYDPVGQFLGGYNKGTQQNFENKVVTDEASNRQKTEEKRQLADQFSQQIKQVTDILKSTEDPVRREAILKTLEQARSVYTGPAAQKYGLADMFAKQLDFAGQTPYEPSSAVLSNGRAQAKIDAKASMAEEKQKESDRQRLVSATNVIDSIDKALGIINPKAEDGGLSIGGEINKFLATGAAGQATENIQSSPAGDLKNYIDSIKANLGFEQLQKMRDASPTGGALGQVTERELAFLQSTIAMLNPGMKAETLAQNLQKIKDSYNLVIDNIKKYGSGMEGVPTIDGVPPIDESALIDNSAAAARNAAAVNAPAPPMPGLGNVNDPVLGLDGTMPAPSAAPAPKRLRFDKQGNMIQ